MNSGIRHRLLAILAADAVAYSRWMSMDGLATLRALDVARQVFRLEAEIFGGKVVDTSGDSVLIVFDTAIGAVRAASAIQRRLSEEAERPSALPLRFRIGIHLGDVIEKSDGTVYGDGVNIASRLQAIAEAGGVIVSQSVQDTCSHQLGATFEDSGTHAVKNIAKPVKAFRLIRLRHESDAPSDVDESATATGGNGGEDSPQPSFESAKGEAPGGGQKGPERLTWLKPGRAWLLGLVATCFVTGVGFLVAPDLRVSRSVATSHALAPAVNIDQEITNRRATAVLAFVDKRGAPTGSTLGDDLADVVAGQMVHAGLRVIGRAATVRQDPSAPDFVRIGQEQGVRFVVAGRITRDGGLMHVDAYLTEIASGAVFRLCEDQYRSDEEVIRSDFGNAVVRALGARYYEVETARAMLPGHEKDPVDLLALAWRDLDRGNTAEELESARGRFEAAVNADPNSGEASIGLGMTYLSQFYCLCSASPRQKLDVAEKVVRRALELAPDNPKSLAAWAEVLLLRQRPDEALRVWRNALEISPEDQNVHVRMAGALVKQGHFAEVQEHLSRVTNLRPYQSRRQQWLLQALADLSFSQGHDDDAYGVLKNWTAEFPNSGTPYLMMAAIDALHGRDGAAAADMAKLRQMLPLSTVSYVVMTYPSTDPEFLAQRARLASGLRKAGLPEGDT
jgi:adenylate cyclase